MVKVKQHSICIIHQVLHSIKKLGTDAKDRIEGIIEVQQAAPNRVDQFLKQ